VLRAAATVEKLGIATVSIIASGFLKQAEVISKGLGVPLAIGCYPGAPMVDSIEQLARKVDDTLAPALIGKLTGDVPRQQVAGAEPQSGAIVCSGTLDEIQERFDLELWSDGLPIVPPTRERVAAFLAYTRREPHSAIRALPQEGRAATAHSIAVNGVMAGCRPEYMPVLIAAVEAICDPLFRIEDAGATPGWEPLVIVNGPIVKELDFNYGQGVMRIGRKANSSIGRFLRLYLRNICGYRIPPGAGDKGSIGQSFLMALAEDEDSAREIGWTTFAEDRGFSRSDNVVTVQSVVCISPPTLSSGDHAIDHVREWADIMGQTFISRAHANFKRGAWNPLIVAGPSIARVIAGEWSKDQARCYLHDNVLISAEKAMHYGIMTSTKIDFAQLVKDGVLPPEYAQSDDPKRMLKVIIKPESVGIVIAGDPGRNQSRGYVNNHSQGPPVSRRVELPSDWAQRLAHRTSAGI